MALNRSVDVHQFAMIPSASIPRSSFNIQKTHKTTFDAGYLVPVYVDEVLPGDTFNLRMTAFARLATPLFPLMDNLRMDSFFFFVPNRLVWSNWARFNGEQDNPDDSTSFVIPQQVSPVGGYAVNSLQDYMGLPTVGQLDPAGFVSHSALPLRAYNLIWKEWFRDENLISSPVVDKDDGPDLVSDYKLLRRGKRHDYFTSALPFPQKGQSLPLPVGPTAPVLPISSTETPTFTMQGTALTGPLFVPTTANTVITGAQNPTGGFSALQWASSGLYADLGQATVGTINQLRQSFQIQKLLERDARGGTRLTEIIRAHFGVTSPDARLQRPEYLGGGSAPITINPVAQTSQETAPVTPLGTLGGIGTLMAHGHGFSQSFTEHGYVIGLVCVRADLTYQQGLRRHWSRSTRYDFYWPAFCMLGEQAILNKEIYVKGIPAQDDLVFGYQERHAEYRYNPSEITGYFRSTSAGTLDAWHLAQRFLSTPTLSPEFIEENPPLDRVLAVGGAADGQHLLFDSFFNIRAARPLPMYSVPGLIDHF